MADSKSGTEYKQVPFLQSCIGIVSLELHQARWERGGSSGTRKPNVADFTSGWNATYNAEGGRGRAAPGRGGEGPATDFAAGGALAWRPGIRASFPREAHGTFGLPRVFLPWFDCPVGSGSRAGGPSAGPARPNPASMDPAAELVGYVNGREISPKLFSEDESLPLDSTQEPIFPPELMGPVQCRSLGDKYESAIEDLHSRHPCSTLNYEVKYVWDVKDTFIWNPKVCLLFPKERIKKLMSVFLQFLKYIQDIVAVTLKLPANKVVCHAKRGDGMFEGKSNKTGIMAAITTFAAK
ncbi:uncharacterized protein LOC131490303 [Neofelis nebulosa]|uniref:uncharacterized protein LOC131490303 n=1 Tax=Neofelis nebulosa TaxID=61452 RepID=UPI00272D52A2|nr:uncharacterized protein LOC131490303 [Neofelis nebulosa]